MKSKKRPLIANGTYQRHPWSKEGRKKDEEEKEKEKEKEKKRLNHLLPNPVGAITDSRSEWSSSFLPSLHVLVYKISRLIVTVTRDFATQLSAS